MDGETLGTERLTCRRLCRRVASSHAGSPTPGDGGRWREMAGDDGRWWEMVGDGGRWWGMVGVWTGRHPRIGKAYMSPTVPTGRQ